MNIIEEVKKLNLPKGEYVVVGSGILSALSLRESRDLDIAVLPKLFKALKETGEWKVVTRWDKLFLEKDGIDILSQLHWEAYPTTVEEAIKTSTMIDDVSFLNPEETILFKKALGREKDQADIKLLEDYLSKPH